MSKPHDHADKAKENHAREGGAHKGASKDQAHGPGEHKAEHKKADAPPTAGRVKGHNPMPDGCHSWGCKAKATQFNFCNEHYDHFKFGLIKKTGEPVPDYEKKFEHYQAHKARRSAARAA